MRAPHLGFRRVHLDKIASNALLESGGDAEELVSLCYSDLLELIDGYRASGWVRDMPSVEPKEPTNETRPNT